MAKIKPAGSRKPAKGSRNPGGVGCLILIVSAFTLLGLLLYYSIARA